MGRRWPQAGCRDHTDTNAKVVKGVVGDPNFGDDSNLYEAMGNVRKSERKSGLSRKAQNAPAAAKAKT